MGCICVVPGFNPSADDVMIYLGVNGRLQAAAAAFRGYGGTVSSDIHSNDLHRFRAEVLDFECNCSALHTETEA